MQSVVGFACLLIGLVHFYDRDRVVSETRSLYFNLLPHTAPVRTFLALAELVAGCALLVTA